MRISLFALVLLTAAPTLADEPTITAQELEAFKRAAAEVEVLRAQVKALTARLSEIEQRVGLASVSPKGLLPADEVFKPSDGEFVEGPGSHGKKASLAKHLKPFTSYVVSFWATWCVPCTSDEELAFLKTLQERLHRQNAELVSVAVDSLDKVVSDPRAPKWLYPLWHRQDGHFDMLPQRFIERVGVGLPLFLVVDKDGRIRWFRKEKLDEAALRELVIATGAPVLGGR